MQLLLLLVPLSVSTNLILGAPPNSAHVQNGIFGGLKNGSPQNNEEGGEEEVELENLKHPTNPQQEVPSSSSASPPPSSSTSTTMSSLNAKRPENEEKPALSDNANSLKYPFHNPDGFDESLLFKKKKNAHDQGAAATFMLPLIEEPAVSAPRRMDPYGGSDIPIELFGDFFTGPLDRSQMDYTPRDIAEYIFWTGDSPGVASAMGDFLKQGVVGREDAVRFLEDVKEELWTIRSRYSTGGTGTNTGGGGGGQRQLQPQRQLAYPVQQGPSSLLDQDYYGGGERGPLELYHQKRGSYMDSSYMPPPLQLTSAPFPEDELLDYEDVVEKLRTMDAKYRESVLEDIIYQMGKSLFEKGGAAAGGRKTGKVSSEFVEGNIPKDLEREVIETLIGAYMDAAAEGGKVGKAEDLERQLEGTLLVRPPVKELSLKKKKNEHH